MPNPHDRFFFKFVTRKYAALFLARDVVAYELWYGAERSSDPALANAKLDLQLE